MNSLPNELLVMILQYIPAEKLLNCQLVNRKFSETVSRNRNRMKKHVVKAYLHCSRFSDREEASRKNFLARLVITHKIVELPITMYKNFVYIYGHEKSIIRLKMAGILASIAGSDVIIQPTCPDSTQINRTKEFGSRKESESRYFVINTENPIDCVCKFVRLYARTFSIRLFKLKNHTLPLDIRRPIMLSFSGTPVLRFWFGGPLTKEEFFLYQNNSGAKYLGLGCAGETYDFVNELLPYTDSFHFFIYSSYCRLWWSNVRQLLEDWLMGNVNAIDLDFEWKETNSFQVTIREDFPSAKADSDGIYHLNRLCDSNSLSFKTYASHQYWNKGTVCVHIKSTADLLI